MSLDISHLHLHLESLSYCSRTGHLYLAFSWENSNAQSINNNLHHPPRLRARLITKSQIADITPIFNRLYNR
jgi:hypothetical protein